MGKILNYGFILNRSLEAVELDMLSYYFTPHLDYCITYMRNKATELEKQALKNFCRKQGADENTIQIYEDFCIMVLDWIKVGNGIDVDVIQCNLKPAWHVEVLGLYKDYRVVKAPAVTMEELREDLAPYFLENGIIFPEYIKNPNTKNMRFFLIPRIITAFESSSEEEMEEFCKQYLRECDNSYVQEALKKYESQSAVRTPTFYLDFCIGAFDWSRIKTAGQEKIFYDACVSLWNFRILSSYQDEGYKVQFVPEIKYNGKPKRNIMY